VAAAGAGVQVPANTHSTNSAFFIPCLAFRFDDFLVPGGRWRRSSDLTTAPRAIISRIAMTEQDENWNGHNHVVLNPVLVRVIPSTGDTDAATRDMDSILRAARA